ncbi:MAG: hypothetical protein JWM64_2543, partial [Frankiales bacterium]|nr:hypothetical protein [Frankiales bacterium]
GLEPVRVRSSAGDDVDTPDDLARVRAALDRPSA